MQAEWIYDAQGNIAAFYDTADGNKAYYLSGDPMVSNGVPVTYNPATGEYVSSTGTSAGIPSQSRGIVNLALILGAFYLMKG